MRKDDTHQTIGALLLWLKKSSAFAALGFAISIFILQSSCQCMRCKALAQLHLGRLSRQEWRGSGAALGYVKGTSSELQQPGGCGEGRMEKDSLALGDGG